MKNARGLLIAVLVLMLAGISVVGQKNTARAGEGEAAVTDSIKWPDVEGWRRSEPQNYPTPELGYSIAYQSRIGGTVTIYVYDMGLKSIPDGIESERTVKEIDDAENQIQSAVELGYYEKAKLVKSDVFVLGGEKGSVKALRKVFELRMQGKDLTSSIYLFGHQNNFVKFRSTRAEEVEGLMNKAVEDLFAALDKTFSGVVEE